MKEENTIMDKKQEDPLLTCVIMPGIERRTGGNLQLKKTLKDLCQLYYKTSEVAKVSINNKTAKVLASLEKKHNLRFPSDLKSIICWPGMCCIQDDPEDFIELPLPGWMRVPSEKKWHIISPFCNNQQVLDYGIHLIDEDQGCCFWYVGWNKGDQSCQVYICETDYYDENFQPNDMKLTSHSLIDFLWDYARYYGNGH